MNAKLSIAVLSLGFLAALSSAASASEFGLSLGKKSKHGSLSFSYSTGGPAFGHASRICAPVYSECGPKKAWVRGHYENVPQKVWVGGEHRTVWIEARFATRYDSCGRPERVCVAPGHWKTIFVPGHFETRTCKAFVPGAWVSLGS